MGSEAFFMILFIFIVQHKSPNGVKHCSPATRSWPFEASADVEKEDKKEKMGDLTLSRDLLVLWFFYL